MKPLIGSLVVMLAVIAVNANAACYSNKPDGCYHSATRKHYLKINYQQPVVYCEYQNDSRGLVYSVCHNCNSKRCVHEYFYDNYCGEKS